MQESQPDWILSIGLLLIILGLSFFYLIRTPRILPQKKTHLILGEMGSGKTSLFVQLRDGKSSPTVCSLKPNSTPMEVAASGASVTLVDLPGHATFNEQMIAHLAGAQKIVYLIDSTDRPGIRASINVLYDILCELSVNKSKAPLLIICNKADRIGEARSVNQITTELEAGINKVKESRSLDKPSPLGGSTYSFSSSSSTTVQIDKASVVKGRIQPIQSFLGYTSV